MRTATISNSWNTDNQRAKETFTQTSRRDGDRQAGEQGGPAARQWTMHVRWGWPTWKLKT